MNKYVRPCSLGKPLFFAAVFAGVLSASALAFDRAIAERLPGADVASGLAVQFTDQFLKRPDWRKRLDLAVSVGATVVRVDLNWDWTEKAAGLYDWSLYDRYSLELSARQLRPLFILNRPNPLYGTPYAVVINGERHAGFGPPSGPAAVAAFARWAAAAAERFRRFKPIWELWNEPDEEGSWPPKPRPADYVELARAGCGAIKRRVADAVVVGPAAAEIPTVWKSSKPLIEAVFADTALMDCLDAVSLHTHRFRQAPETLSRDYAVLRANYMRAAAVTARKLIIDTEWGDSVSTDGISEENQALWLPRMYLTNLMEDVPLTNWYCLMDVGPDEHNIEHRFGLVRFDGSTRPAYRAYQVLARELGTMSLREVLTRFDRRTAEGATVLRFCDVDEHCKLVAWTTEGAYSRKEVSVPGWRVAGPAIGHLGQELHYAQETDAPLRIQVTTAVRYIPVMRDPSSSE
jgi:polysaccharide biosynthesis protein PslG